MSSFSKKMTRRFNGTPNILTMIWLTLAFPENGKWAAIIMAVVVISVSLANAGWSGIKEALKEEKNAL